MAVQAHFRAASRLQAEIRDAIGKLESGRVPAFAVPCGTSDSGQQERLQAQHIQPIEDRGLHHRGQQTQAISFKEAEERVKDMLLELEREEMALGEQISALTVSQTSGGVSMWRARHSQVQQERLSLNRALLAYSSHRKAQEDEVTQRQQLLHRVGTLGKNANGQNNGEATSILIGDGDSLDRSRRIAADMENQGFGILKALGDQNATIRGVQEKLSDVIGTLGVSTALMRIIERRQYQDKLILYGGMGFILFLIFGLYFWIRYS